MAIKIVDDGGAAAVAPAFTLLRTLRVDRRRGGEGRVPTATLEFGTLHFLVQNRGTDRLSAVTPFDRRCGWYTSQRPRVRFALHLNIGIVVRRVVFRLCGCRDVGEWLHSSEGGFEYPLHRNQLRFVPDERTSCYATQA